MRTSSSPRNLELAARVEGRYARRFVPNMAVRYHSRETFGQYAKQMYRYGFMKSWFLSLLAPSRGPDFVSLARWWAAACAVALRSWRPLMLNLPFALAEAMFVVCYQRCPIRVAVLTFPAWRSRT